MLTGKNMTKPLTNCKHFYTLDFIEWSGGKISGGTFTCCNCQETKHFNRKQALSMVKPEHQQELLKDEALPKEKHTMYYAHNSRIQH